MPWRVAIHREQPFLGRIEANSENQLGVETSIKRCISSENPALSPSRFFTADTTCHTPLKEGPFPILRAH